MSTRRRKILGLLLAFVAALIVWRSLPSREPTWQDRPLSGWLTMLRNLNQSDDRPNANDEPATEAEQAKRRAWHASHELAVTAVRQIGHRALPYLTKWLRPPHKTSGLQDKMQEWLNEYSPVKVRFPEKQVRSDLAWEGFAALGAAAKPAIPQLGRLLEDPAATHLAAPCLVAIGPDAFPVLARALGNKNPTVQQAAFSALLELAPAIGPRLIPVLMGAVTNAGFFSQSGALTALGNFGPAARELTPWLTATMQNSNDLRAGWAMRVFPAVAESPQQYLPLFDECLARNNSAADAAFALAWVGTPGIPPLLQAMTNQNPRIRCAAIAALRLHVPKKTLGRRIRLPDYEFYEFSRSSAAFDRRESLTSSTNLGLAVGQPRWLAPILTGLLDHTNPAVRLQSVQLLGSCGRSGLLGLSHGAGDPDEAVRQEAQAALGRLDIEVREGAVIRGPKDKKRIALVFTGHEYAEGGEVILDELAKHEAFASFFLTGDFLANGNFHLLARRLVKEGHYLGPHSDKHLLYCPWEGPKKALVTCDQFSSDLRANLDKVRWYAPHQIEIRLFLPPYEHYNLDIADQTDLHSMTLVNFTPGTRSAADYTAEADTNFVSSQAIFDSIISKEQQDPHGLNGFILLLHLGSGPRRIDKFHTRFGELLDYFQAKGYQMVTMDELFEPGDLGSIVDRRKKQSEAVSAAAAFARRYGLPLPGSTPPAWLGPTNSAQTSATN